VDAPTPAEHRTLTGTSPGPLAVRSQGLAAASLVAAASAVFLCPTLSPLTVLLGPVAWWLGTLDRRRALRAGQRQLAAGEMGMRLGKLLSMVALTFAVLFALFWISYAIL
jgi:hypothetical protein